MDDRAPKPATAARIYDYYLGGIHNFPADREAARQGIAVYPFARAGAQANRAFLGRAVRTLAEAGVRQFLDLGSGLPTRGNVHEIAQAVAADARVVYVDIDPEAVAEGQQLLDGNPYATAIRADLREPRTVLDHPEVRRLLDPDAPTGLLMAAVLHFVPDDNQAYAVVEQFVGALRPGSYLVVSHAAAESFDPPTQRAYRQPTATPAASRTRAGVTRFFAGLELLEPGVVGLHEWHVEQDEQPPAQDTHGPGGWVGVARKP